MGRTLLNNVFNFLENSYSRFYDRISNCGRLDAGPRSRIGALSRHRGPGLTRGYAGGGVGHGGLGGGQPGPRWKEGSRAWVRDTASWREGMRLEIWLSVCVLSLLPRALSYGLASHVTLVLVVLYILVSSNTVRSSSDNLSAYTIHLNCILPRPV